MSAKCPRCHSLVASDPTTGTHPDYCPYCDGLIASSDSTAIDDDATPEPRHEPLADADHAAADLPAEVNADADVVEDDAATANQASAEPVAGAGEAAMDGTILADDAPEAIADDDNVESSRPTIDVADDAEVAATPGVARQRKRNAPSFVRRRAPTTHSTPRRMWFIAAGLALLALMQIVLADRARLAASERWRPMIVSVCNVLQCSVPPWHQPTAFAMLDRDVRQHPYMPGALRVDATFRNNARWPQPWPDLTLTLSDINGHALGMRTFSPQEYLDRKVTQNEIGSGQVAAIRMEVMEPAAGVVSFSFDFH